MQSIDIKMLFGIFNQLERRGVDYGFGAKADDRIHNPRSTGRLSTPVDTIDHIDCSGFTRYALFQATRAAVTLPDGSQNQLDWFANSKDKTIKKMQSYSDVASQSATPCLYISFIKPHVNGCGAIGHVWFTVNNQDGVAPETLESHGGAGVDSRPWNSIVLRTEVFSTFQLPTI